MQEAIDADLLLHVVDAANPAYAEQIHEVQRVLKEIGASDLAQMLVFNKTDAIAVENRPVRLLDTYEVDGIQMPRIFLSARTSDGLPLLRQQLAARVLDTASTPSVPESNPDSHGAEL